MWDSRIRGNQPIIKNKSILNFKKLNKKYQISPPTSINFDNRGSHLSNNSLVLGHEEGEISFWDIKSILDKPNSSTPRQIVRGLHFDAVRDVSFSYYDIHKGKYSLISGSFDSRVKIWDISMPQNKVLNDPFNVDVDIVQTLSNPIPPNSLDDHKDRVVLSIWHSQLPVIVTTSADCTFKIYCDADYLDKLC